MDDDNRHFAPEQMGNLSLATAPGAVIFMMRDDDGTDRPMMGMDVDSAREFAQAVLGAAEMASRRMFEEIENG